MSIRQTCGRRIGEVIYQDCLGVRVDANFGAGKSAGYLGPMNQKAADRMLEFVRRGGDVTVTFNPRLAAYDAEFERRRGADA